jgi:hypothetical protein
MSRLPFCVLLLVACACTVQAQGGLAIGLRVGVERYDLGALRDWQEAEQADGASIGVAAAITDAFPAYLAFGAEVSFPTWWDDRAGVSLRYGSTGGRVAYADYSGSIRADWVVQRWSIGAFVEQRLFEAGPFAAVLALHGLADYGTVDFEVATTLFDLSSAEQLPTLEAWSVSAEPEIGLERTFGPVAVRLRIGGGVSFGGVLEVEGERVALPGSDSGASLQWLGWRSGLTVAYSL